MKTFIEKNFIKKSLRLTSSSNLYFIIPGSMLEKSNEVLRLNILISLHQPVDFFYLYAFHNIDLHLNHSAARTDVFVTHTLCVKTST